MVDELDECLRIAHQRKGAVVALFENDVFIGWAIVVIVSPE
jgi:hypothetical protein